MCSKLLVVVAQTLSSSGSARRLDDGELDDEEVLLLMHENQHRNLHANLPYEKYHTVRIDSMSGAAGSGNNVNSLLPIFFQ